MSRRTMPPHLFRLDQGVPAATDLRHPEQPGMPFCTCGLRQDHPAHTLPAMSERDVQELAAGEQEES